MSVQLISAEQALTGLSEFSSVIDARSESEYAEDHLPGAVNWPSLRDAERQQVGTQYKQVNAFEAKKQGAAMVARNVAGHIEREVLDKPKDWKPLVYCWRGGKRSGSLALILDQIGCRVSLIEGGYKAFRAALLLDLPQLSERLHFEVVCGTTGSGKTRFLQALAAQGAQVLDLEALAKHRSSVLGLIPGQSQPTQKAFDTRVWTALQAFDTTRPVYIESESKKVGNVVVPESLMTAMRRSPCLHLQLSEEERVKLLLEDYDFFVRDIEFFCNRLGALTEARGKAMVADWQARSRAGGVASVVKDLLVLHYDPVYLQSMQRNFTHYAAARPLAPRDHSVAAMQALAATLAGT